MEIKGFIENSLLEWEGKLSCVLFLPLCNLRCRYCHASHLLEANLLESISRQQILSYIKRQEGWLDGAVISGGEPTLHGEELLGLLTDIRNAGPAIMVETNGTLPQWVERLVSEAWVDAIAMDVKAPLTADAYRAVTRRDVDVEAVRASIRAIKRSGLPHEFRITLVPGLVGRAELEAILPDLEGARQIALQNFKPDLCLSEPLRHVTPFTADELKGMAALAAAGGARVVLRGRDHAAVAAKRGS